jgi:hypothetical protein
MRKLTLLWSVAGLVCLGGVTIVLLGDRERSSCFNPGGNADHLSACSRYGPTIISGRIFVGLGIALLLVGFGVFWRSCSTASAATPQC